MNDLLSSSQKNLSPREILHQTALKAPKQSGVYMWRNKAETVIYVGKAKNLKNRLSSYFSGNKDIKTRLLISNARSIEYITTNNEYEAFLLENNLIKKYTPRYNINLKDGKSYPVLRITKEKYPRIFKTRQVIHDGSVYFGPFPDASALDTFIETLYEIYPLRHCKSFKEKSSPCMYYHIGRCLAPCSREVKQSTYTEFIEEITSLLENKGEETLKKLQLQMKEAAKNLNFEKAARLRDGIRALSILQNQNSVESFAGDDRDYISSWREGELISFTVLKIREGKLLGRDNYRTISLNEDTEIFPEFMSAFYTEKESIPPAIYIDSVFADEEKTALFIEEIKNIQHFLDDSFGKITSIINYGSAKSVPGIHRASLDMARQNAHEDIIRRMRERGDYPAMEELQKVLGLPKLPERIEGFDIAHIGGKFPVASLISFYRGNPDKKNYRYFRLKTTDGLIDDFQSMREATTRRYTRLLNEKKELPDLILIDGGIGQVNAVDGVLKSIGLDIPIAGLAKRDEEIWRPHTSSPVCLPKRSDALRLLQRVRDETHRFATSRNQELRTKENTVTPFIKINGIGKERDKLLMKKYGSLEKMCAASESEIAMLLNVDAGKASMILTSAKNLYEKQKEVKEKEMLSLDLPGTTKEKAARSKRNQLLAQMASGQLMAAEDNSSQKE
ncbi:excinuclease ABC subunit UvrC [Treponema sp.]|uniref:excinuclease ABC subunit UvrC n=1 Tax=Treponema sp. TaxID=166 RepID=UPI0025EF1BC4|nr:excinuclease ABC subunit UvrC [Treponema sp.]MCR5217124.1 excinuclease ABC subunit UvrC [Treponema sp.]